MNLKYRIHSVSSQNSDHPASSLLAKHQFDQNSNSNTIPQNFWESQITSKYPQQITIQFYIPIRTKNLQITFHPYKIPEKVQIFVKSTKKQKYQKLGYIKPNSNQQTNFLQKQKKTLFFQYPCTLIKLVLHKNHRNNRNLFDQVAIWDLKVQGECLPASELANLDYDFLESLQTDQQQQQKSIQISASRINNQLSQASRVKDITKNQQGAITSSLFPQVFKLLQNAKNDAVEKQDFQKASNIKKTMSTFKDIENQIQILQQEKRKALQQEDFDKCHRLKNQILKKKDQANFKIKQIQQHYLQNMSEAHSRLIPHSYHPIQQNNSLTNRSYHQQQEPKSPIPNRSRYHNPQSNNIEGSVQPDQSNYYDKYESQVLPALRKKIEEQFNSVSKINQSVSDSVDISYSNNIQSTKRNNTDESRNILGNPNIIQEYAQESLDLRNLQIDEIMGQYTKLEPMEPKDVKKYEQYFGYIQQDLWRMALSQKFWKLKGYVLDKIMDFSIQYGFHIQAIMQIIAIVIEDTHPVNVKKCLLLLQKLIYLQNKDSYDFQQNSSSRYYIDIILANLLHLLIDTKQQFRKLACQIYKNLPDFSLIPLEHSIKSIVKENYSIHNTSGMINNKKSKRKYTPKHLLAKITLVQYFVVTYHDSEIFFVDIIKWAVKMLQDPDSNVKSAATKLLLEISLREKHFYLKIKQQILKKKSRNQIWENFDAYYENMLISLQEQQKKQLSRNSQSDSEEDIYKKQTIMVKHKSPKKNISKQDDDPESHLRKIQESPIQSPNKMRQSAEIQLAYSQQSLFHEQSHQSHEWFANKDNNQDKYGDIHVMEPFDDQIEGMCDYCFQKIDQSITLHQHLLEYCPALVACLFCNSQIYFRQLNQHWISECPKKCHQQCPRCLVAFEIDEINQHKARKVCRKVNLQSGLQICPLCYTDVEGDDLAWVQHASICQGVKQIRGKIKDKSKQLENQSMKSM